MLGESLHITIEYLTQEAKVASLISKMEAMEAETSKLKQSLIESMGKANTLKEKVKALSDDLRAERQLTLEKESSFLASRKASRLLLPGPLKPFRLLTSTT